MYGLRIVHNFSKTCKSLRTKNDSGSQVVRNVAHQMEYYRFFARTIVEEENDPKNFDPCASYYKIICTVDRYNDCFEASDAEPPREVVNRTNSEKEYEKEVQF